MRVRQVSIVSDMPIPEGIVESDDGYWIKEEHFDGMWYRWSIPIVKGEYYGDGAWYSSMGYGEDMKAMVTVRESDLLEAIHYLQDNMLVGQFFELMY